MRSRILNPGFFLNEELTKLGPLSMIMFEGLWCIADREGRLEDRPVRIKAMIMPYFDCDPEQILSGLAASEFILRYEAGGRKCLAIPKFSQYQKIHERETPSALPPPPARKGSPKARLGRTLGAPKVDEDQHATEVEVESGSESEVTTPFDLFWAAYPRHEAKQRAKQEFKNLDPSPELLEQILQDARTRYVGVDLSLIPHPSTYLHQRRWIDEHKPAQQLALKPGTASGPVLSKGNQNLAKWLVKETKSEDTPNGNGTGASRSVNDVHQGAVAGSGNGRPNGDGVVRDIRGNQPDARANQGGGAAAGARRF